MDFSRILIIKPSSLGDIVHALPTVADLRRRFPSARITWLVKREWAAVLEDNPHLDEVLALGLSVKGWPGGIRAVRAGRFDTVVDLQGLLRSALLGWISGAPVRIGFANGREGSPWFYTERVPVPSPSMHAVDRYLLTAKYVGADPGEVKPSEFPLPHDTQAQARVEVLLAAAGIQAGATLVAMNPSARWNTKRWPLESFAAVGDRLQEDEAAGVVLIGGRDERHVGKQVLRAMRTAPIDLMGQTTLKELIALLRRVRLLVTNDSGPMHLAAAVGTPVIALFGPTDPARTGPYGAGHTVLRSGLPCRPTFQRDWTNVVELECLTSIRPENVIEAAMRLLEQPLNVQNSLPLFSGPTINV